MGCGDLGHGFGFEHGVERSGVLAGTVMDDEPELAVEVHEQVPCGLGGPGSGRVRGDPTERHSRVPISMKNRARKRGNVAVSTHAKSVVMIPFAWLWMNCAHVGTVRSGVGSIPAARRIVHTVDAAIL